jgi:two-component system nitrate/nitrite response regulator NarL
LPGAAVAATLSTMPSRVLIVDDDPAFRRIAARAVAAAGHQLAGEAGTLAEAHRAMTALRPDAVLLDVNLPDGSGIRLATELAAAPAPPRVLLTSSDPEAVPRRLLARCGAAGFVAKADLLGADLRSLL